jgi:hypothetical protein
LPQSSISCDSADDSNPRFHNEVTGERCRRNHFQ